MNKIEVAWLAGLLEGEGSFQIIRNTQRQAIGSPHIDLSMVDQDVIERAAALMGGGMHERKRLTRGGKKVYRTWVSGDKALAVMRAIAPLMGWRRKAKIIEIIRLAESRPGRSAWQLGEKNRQAKLAPFEVRAIRAAEETPKQLSKRFNVNVSNIRLILQRKTWKHL